MPGVQLLNFLIMPLSKQRIICCSRSLFVLFHLVIILSLLRYTAADLPLGYLQTFIPNIYALFLYITLFAVFYKSLSWVRLDLCFNVTFNKVSVIYHCVSLLAHFFLYLVEEPELSGENYRHASSHWQTHMTLYLGHTTQHARYTITAMIASWTIIYIYKCIFKSTSQKLLCSVIATLNVRSNRKEYCS